MITDGKLANFANPHYSEHENFAKNLSLKHLASTGGEGIDAVKRRPVSGLETEEAQ
jgi:hypothetical protein